MPRCNAQPLLVRNPFQLRNRNRSHVQILLNSAASQPQILYHALTHLRIESEANIKSLLKWTLEDLRYEVRGLNPEQMSRCY